MAQCIGTDVQGRRHDVTYSACHSKAYALISCLMCSAGPEPKYSHLAKMPVQSGPAGGCYEEGEEMGGLKEGLALPAVGIIF